MGIGRVDQTMVLQCARSTARHLGQRDHRAQPAFLYHPRALQVQESEVPESPIARL
jgi:hypothetical protein